MFSSQLLLVWSYSSLQVDVGEKQLMITATGHILESSSMLPRSLTIDLSFSKILKNPPQVFIQTQYMDWKQDLPGGFILQVSFINTKGFKIIVIAVSPQPLYQVFVNWFAFDDPRIQVLSFETEDVQQLKTGQGNRIMSYQIGHDLKDASNGVIGIIGIKHIALDKSMVEFKVIL
ncbi:unnamed protein product [Paramecium sonneborni]|uniref:H-type lectin domain-containing protein n=1 Tax=Paramecium sonneborni TaxID=65129 RepID=A0A8S1RT41_9CILI|nr:unnamed protein product [Paramecium sonneborni]